MYYIYSQRLNLEPVRPDVNAMWTSRRTYRSSATGSGVSRSNLTARGHAYLQPGIEDVVFMNMEVPEEHPSQRSHPAGSVHSRSSG